MEGIAAECGWGGWAVVISGQEGCVLVFVPVESAACEDDGGRTEGCLVIIALDVHALDAVVVVDQIGNAGGVNEVYAVVEVALQGASAPGCTAGDDTIVGSLAALCVGASRGFSAH